MTWPTAATDMLRIFWPDHSASIVAARITAECGFAVSRCAVIGKAGRIGLAKKVNVLEAPRSHMRDRDHDRVALTGSSDRLLSALALEKRP
jgi:hypothetical protein